MMRSAVALVACAAGAAFAASPMQPGRWDSTVSIVRAGQVPLVSTDSDCVSQKDIDDGSKSLPKPGDNCELSNVATAEGRTTYDFACRDGDVLRKGRAEFVIEATRYDGKLELVSRKGNGPEAAMSMTWTARRMGECAK
jgi:hypothetical protein